MGNNVFGLQGPDPMEAIWNPVGYSGQRMFPRGPYPGASYPQQQEPQGPSVAQALPKIGGNLVKDFMNKGNVFDKLPGVAGDIGGKVIPGLGAAAGTMGLIHGGSTGHNLLSGLEAGAGYGSFIPGIGTGIGALIGLGVGGIRSLFHPGPSKEELAGRSAQAGAIQDITRGASQAQLNEAQGAMNSGKWKDIQSPLGVIVMRDHLMQTGMDPALADKTAQGYMTNMWNAEKQGAGAVQSAIPNPNARFTGQT